METTSLKVEPGEYTPFRAVFVQAFRSSMSAAAAKEKEDLVVRVTGFSAYFASLSPEFRQLVVDRIINEN